jgi:ABC-type transport system involved in cytochrome c biogenesis permease subunit
MEFQWNDLINGIFESVGGFFIVWLNVIRMKKDKTVKGVNIWVQVFYTAWGIWNLFYYPSLNQWFSFIGGLGLVVGNGVWCVMAAYYTWESKRLSMEEKAPMATTSMGLCRCGRTGCQMEVSRDGLISGTPEKK